MLTVVFNVLLNFMISALQNRIERLRVGISVLFE
jgi:hypothetical protein